MNPSFLGRPIPQPSDNILDPSFLFFDLFLRLPSRVPAAVHLHLRWLSLSLLLRRLLLLRLRLRLRLVLVLLFVDNFIPIYPFRLRVDIHHAIQHKPTTLTELVNRPHGVDGPVQRAPGVEVFLDCREEVLAGTEVCLAQVVRGVHPGVLEGLVGGHAALGFDGQTAFDEVAGGLRDTVPVFGWSEGVVGREDGLHFF